MIPDAMIDDAVQAYLTEQCYGADARPDGLMIAAEAGWHLWRTRLIDAEERATRLAERLRIAEKVCQAVGMYAASTTAVVPFTEPKMLDAHAKWRSYVHAGAHKEERAAAERATKPDDLLRYEANAWTNDDGEPDCYVVEAVRRHLGFDAHCEQIAYFPATDDGKSEAEELAERINAALDATDGAAKEGGQDAP